jgi:protein-S-isoprenylcysteine O-methyltransferase Ste14
MKIALQTIASMVFGLLFFGVGLFLPAWTFDYWQAWLFIAVFLIAAMVPVIYLGVSDPAALQRRMHAGPIAETRAVQKVVIAATILSVFAVVVLSAFDHRFGWSDVPLPVVVIGDLLVAGGLTMAQLVIVQNRYAGATITVEDEQPLVTTGFYGLVRHPMYVGVLIMLVGTPLALDSYWGLAAIVPALLALGLRIVDEEEMLRHELDGYDEYIQKVNYRLVPGVW